MKREKIYQLFILQGILIIVIIIIIVIILIIRCAVYQKLNKQQEALKDVETSLKVLEETQGSRSLFARAHLQKG